MRDQGVTAYGRNLVGKITINQGRISIDGQDDRPGFYTISPGHHQDLIPILFHPVHLRAGVDGNVISTQQALCQRSGVYHHVVRIVQCRRKAPV